MSSRPLSSLRRHARAVPTLVSVLALVLAGCSSSGSHSSPETSSAAGSAPGASGFDGAALPPSVSPPGFTLRDQTGARVSLSDYRGQVVILTVLASDCGSACVVIAQQIRGALDELPKPVPVLILSADPQADTPARVKRFLERVSLSGRVRYLTGSRAQLRPIWHAFRVLPVSAGRAAFARSASVFLIDRSGRERVIFQLEQLTPEALSHDVRKLLG
jgi:protein SCO1/2